MTRLVDRLVDKGLAIREGKTIIPLPLSKLANLPIVDIILRYRMILNGILNYYSFVKNKPQLRNLY